MSPRRGPEPFVGQLALRKGDRLHVAIAAVPLVLAAALCVAFPTVSFALTVAFLGALCWVLHKRATPEFVAATVRVNDADLRIDETVIARPQIRTAQIVPTAQDRFAVRVVRKGGPAIDLLVRDREEGLRLLHALGFDAAQTVVTFRGRVHRRIDVGADGVMLRWLWKDRFLPSATIREVDRYVAGLGDNKVIGVAITLEGGEVVRIPLGSRFWSEEKTGVLVERIREARETHARGEVSSASALLGRGEHDLRAWLQELRAIGTGANATLRTAPVDPGDLWRVVESASAPAEERAAAAVALAAAGDGEVNGRLRAAAGAVADVRLRVAIEAATGEDEAALEAALEGIGGEAIRR